MHFTEAKGILLSQNFMNIYRGCTHGCIYCDVRSECYQFKHKFDDVEVKSNAPILLEQALRKKRKKCTIKTGYMSDSYMPYEKELCLTRQCLEKIHNYNFSVTIQTKSNLVLRDLDLLEAINKKNKSIVQMTITTYDEELCKYIEPNVCSTRERFEALKMLHGKDIPTVVWITPILPFINDTESNIMSLLKCCLEAGVKGIICGIGVTLRNGNREYFYKKLEEHFPGVQKKYEQKYGFTYDCKSDHEPALMKMVKDFCDDNKILLNDATAQYMFSHEPKDEVEQLSLF